MLCITVVSRGEFNSICSQASWEHFQWSKYQLWFETQKRKSKGRRENFLFTAVTGACAHTTKVWTLSKLVFWNQKKITHWLKWTFNQALHIRLPEISKSLEVYFKYIINIQDLANKFQIKINLLWNYYISFHLPPPQTASNIPQALEP